MKRRRQSQKEEREKEVPEAPSLALRQNYYLFPNYSVQVVLFLVLLGRLSYVTDPVSWWTLHPDEIYQVIEVSHGDVYGYGFESSGHQRPIYSEYGFDLPREAMRGIYSWIIPKFYSCLLVLKEALDIHTRPYVFCRQLHVIVSGLLPASVFLLCRRLYQDWPSDVATVAAMAVGFGDYFVLLGTHTLPQSLLSTIVFAVASVIYKRNATPVSLDNNDNYTLKDTKRTSGIGIEKVALVSVGFFQGLTCYIKPDITALVVLLHLFLFRETHVKDVKGFIFYFTGITIGLFVCGYFDFVYYSMWFISPVRWLNFQWSHAGNIYGTQDKLYYFEHLFFNLGSHTIMLLSTIFVTGLLAAVTYTSLSTYRELRQWASENKGAVVMSIKLCWCSLLLILVHSLQPHKEMRFVHDALVLLSCAGAGSLFSLYQLFRILSESQNQEKVVIALKLFVYAEAALYAIRACTPATMKSRFADMNEIVIPDMPDSWHVNKCLDFVGRQSDLTGVVLDHPIHLFGGYTILHRNVPIIAKTHYDFREWDMKARINFTSEVAISLNQSLSSFERISNYVAVENGKLILSIVSRDHSPYNYAVLTRNRRFPKLGFKEKFRSGNVTVFKRMKTRGALQYLSNLVQQIPVGNDVAVLQVEAAWLIAFGLHSLARGRLERSLELDNKCLPCWQLLYGVYLDLGLDAEAKNVARECEQVLGKNQCAAKSRILPLHPEYSFGISRLRQPKPIIY